MMNNKIREALDQSMADVTWKEQNRQRVLHTVRQETRPARLRKPALIPVIALLLLCAAMAVAGATSEDVNSWLYQIWPKAATTLMPVNMSCEDKGIRMEVLSAVVDDTEMYITFSMQDLEGDRIHEDTEAIASLESGLTYDWSSATAEPLYMKDEKTIVFGQKSIMEGSLENHKTLTTSVDTLYRHEDRMVDLIPFYRQAGEEVKTMPVPENAAPFGGYIRNESQYEHVISLPIGDPEPDSSDYTFGAIPDTLCVLDSSGGKEIQLADGIYLSGIGKVDGLIHVQLHYADYWGLNALSGDHHTDVWVELYDADDNSRQLVSNYDVEEKLVNGLTHLYWKTTTEDGKQDYWQEMMFPVDPDLTETQQLLAEISTDYILVDGNWTVDIPLRIIKRAQ